MNLYHCEICAKPFKRKEHLTRHKRSHSSDRPFTCPVCVRSFTRQDSLLRHLSSHAKPSTRGGGLRNQTNNSQISPNDLPETATLLDDLTGATPAPELRYADQQQTTDIKQATPDANADHEEDLDVPPELVKKPDEGPHDFPSATPCIVSPTIANCHSSEITNEFYTSVGGLRTDHQSSPQSIGTAQGTSEPPDTFDWPEELYSSTVDRHARNWLRDLCAGDSARTGE